jgi:hypothetical protein
MMIMDGLDDYDAFCGPFIGVEGISPVWVGWSGMEHFRFSFLLFRYEI